jgi:hypothetical protein
LLTSGRRWSRGRLGGEMYDGEVVVHAGGRRLGPCFLSPAGARPPPSGAARRSLGDEGVLAPGPVLGSSLARRDAAAARPFLPQRRGAAVARPPSPSTRCSRPFGGRRNPKRGRLALPPGHTDPLLLNWRRGGSRGESPSMPLASPPSGAGGVPRSQLRAPWMPAGGANPSFTFLPWRT